MQTKQGDPLGARVSLGPHGAYFRLRRLCEVGLLDDLARLPFSLRILLESLLRHCGDGQVGEEDVARLCAWIPGGNPGKEIPFFPARVLMQDFTGIPCLADLAAMRDAVAEAGGDPDRVNPHIPVDLVVDHSVQVDVSGCPDALARNAALEFERNRERYAFLRWGARAFRGVRIIPPATGIVHQVNLEFLSHGVRAGHDRDSGVLMPDTLVGTDSHTPMINALGVLGWGVGGIEAEAALLGHPLILALPDVVGVELTGSLREGVTATDLVLTVTERLRAANVVDQFVEFFGAGATRMSVPDRATVSNMAPEYGATCGFFPFDDQTVQYLRRTGRATSADRLRAYGEAQELFRSSRDAVPEYSRVVRLDLAEVEPSVAGPHRPQDRLSLAGLRKAVRALPGRTGGAPGTVAIAAITSCTNTSNPEVMVGAGLLARNAVAAGLTVKPWVKTSLAPGSRTVALYLERAGLREPLEALGFHVVAYGCTTCIGNSGPLLPAATAKGNGRNLVAVLSGNRNFEGRIHPQTGAAFLMSPPLVVAYALAGTVDIDLTTEPLGTDRHGAPVFLRDLWPSREDIVTCVARVVTPDLFDTVYRDVMTGPPSWSALPATGGRRYAWEDASMAIRRPPFLDGLTPEPLPGADILGARALAVFGDGVTTDHISPAGEIAVSSPAGRYLIGHGVPPDGFNTYGARRGNHEVMVRGTFANGRLRNVLMGDEAGGVTLYFGALAEERLSIFDAAMRYRADGTPLVVLAGRAYGMGSSRDWAAKGTRMLGVKAVIAESFERIHRANLIGMGVLPLIFRDGESVRSLGLTGRERLSLRGLAGGLAPHALLHVEAQSDGAGMKTFDVQADIHTAAEADDYRHGGILERVARELLAADGGLTAPGGARREATA